MNEIDERPITSSYLDASIRLKNINKRTNKYFKDDDTNDFGIEILKECIGIQIDLNRMMMGFTETLRIMNNNNEETYNKVEKEMKRVIDSMQPSKN